RLRAGHTASQAAHRFPRLALALVPQSRLRLLLEYREIILWHPDTKSDHTRKQQLSNPARPLPRKNRPCPAYPHRARAPSYLTQSLPHPPPDCRWQCIGRTRSVARYAPSSPYWRAGATACDSLESNRESDQLAVFEQQWPYREWTQGRKK